MSYSITFSSESLTDLRQQLLTFLDYALSPNAAAASGNGAAAEEGFLEEDAKPAKPAKSKPKPKPVSAEDVKNVMTKHVGKFGQAASIALVREHAGVSKIKDIAAEHYAAVVEAAQAELSE